MLIMLLTLHWVENLNHLNKKYLYSSINFPFYMKHQKFSVNVPNHYMSTYNIKLSYNNFIICY